VRSIGDELALDPDWVTSDVGEFEQLLDRGSLEAAVDLFIGPLLDGFHLSDGAEFERWVDTERARLGQRYASALESLAEASESHADYSAAARWWCKLAAHDPYSDRVCLRLMRAFEAAGDRAAAIRQARVHAVLLREDFGAEADAEVTAFAERLRGQSAGPNRQAAESVDARLRADRILAISGAADRDPVGDGSSAEMMDPARNEHPSPLSSSRGEIPPVRPAAAPRESASVLAVMQQSGSASLGEPASDTGFGHRSPSTSGRIPPLYGRWRLGSRLSRGVIAVIAVALLASGGMALRRAAVFSGLPAVPIATLDIPAGGLVTVAVLTFEDEAADGDQSWFADALGEAIQLQLAQVGGLRVVGHYSSIRPDARSWSREVSESGVPVDAPSIGDSLGAQYLLIAGVRKLGDSVSVNPQLIDARTGERVWGAPYTSMLSPGDVEEIPRNIAHQAARALELRPASEGRLATALPDDAEYQAYLEGRYHLRRFQSGVAMRETELDQSVAHLRQVVALSPSWAPGIAALGEALSWAGMFESEQGEITSTFAESKQVLERAIELDPDDARTYATLGYVVHRSELDYVHANALFKRALELDPDQYWHCGYAFFLLWAGRYEQAAQAFRQAEALDPLYSVLKDYLIASYLCTGRYAEAIEIAELVLAEYPGWSSIRRNLVLALYATGREAEAFAAIDASPNAQHPYNDVVRALLHARAGRVAQAEDLIRGVDEAALTDELRSSFPRRELSPAPLYGAVLVALGRREEAIELLQSALDRDPDVLLYDRCFPELKTLEDDLRYKELLRRTGVPI
jgi:TolB-like protein/Tfp pilus assembly protein PilF